MTTQTIDRLLEFSKHIRRKMSLQSMSHTEALNLAIEMWKADSLDTIAEALKVDGDISQSLSEISKAIKNEL
jgi:uncharacterized protein YeeX (DUF496 family)